MTANIVTGPGATRYLREQRLADMLEAIQAWLAATGEERAQWRRIANTNIRQFRNYFLIPEREAFLAAAAKHKDAHA